jgi:hypothetical protein
MTSSLGYRPRRPKHAGIFPIMSFEEVNGLSGVIILLIGAAIILWQANQ